METAASEYVVGVDIGSSRTRCLIAEIVDGEITITGQGNEPSRGLRRGEVIDVAAAGYAVDRAIQAAEQQADVDVQSVFLAAGSRHTGYVNNRACVGITREEHTVTTRDVQNVLAAARRVPLREDTVAIGTLVRSYSVDDVRHVREPAGMHGTRLEAETHVVTDARSTVENMMAGLDPSKYEVEESVFAGHAAAEAALDDDEKKLGVAIVDIGAGTTSIMLYRDNAPTFSSVVPIGGDHITSDIAVGMDVGLADAARLKENHGSVEAVRPSHAIMFERINKPGSYCVEGRRLHAIVDCRVHEILDIIRRELMRAGVRPATIRVVLSGGSSRLPGLDALAETVLGCPVRVGRPRLSDGPAMGPDMATVIGLLIAGKQVRDRHLPRAATSNPAGRLLSWLRQLF
jgi:cell division protein FtsA